MKLDTRERKEELTFMETFCKKEGSRGSKIGFLEEATRKLFIDFPPQKIGEEGE